jgi:hypothetical protein
MTLAYMRALGVQQLVAHCLNDMCRSTAAGFLLLLYGLHNPAWVLSLPVAVSLGDVLGRIVSNLNK